MFWTIFVVHMYQWKGGKECSMRGKAICGTAALIVRQANYDRRAFALSPFPF